MPDPPTHLHPPRALVGTRSASDVRVCAQDADTLFNSIDTDNSGEISKEELREHLKTFTKYSFKVRPSVRT